MKILITGATGFVGRHVVAAALAQGHQVRAVVRPAGSAAGLGPAADDENVESARVDLRSAKGLAEAVDGVDAVIHLAAAKAGDFYSQFAGTVVATENLLAAMAEVGVDRLVAVSTFSVYDYRNLPSNGLLDESSPIDLEPDQRDEYARTKLLQEELYREWGSIEGHRMVILRPGMIYGAGELWHPLLGAELGPLFIRVEHGGVMPMIYVENAADALVAAAARLADPESGIDGETINLVDDQLPTQQAYVDEVIRVMDPPRSVNVPWPVLRIGADALARANRLLVGGRAKFPGIVVPDKLHGRFKPLRYDNAKAKRLLDWQPRFTLQEAVARSAADEAAADEAATGTAGPETTAPAGV
ncbi:MAG: NAD-dependent epimerase/dehydratase family protein [Actinomycetota bacterium]